MPDYENLGFQVNVDGADSAVSRLDEIIERLEYIYKLEGKKTPSRTGSTNQNTENFKKEEKQVKRNTKALTSYIAKLTSVVMLARRFAHFMSGAIKESANYIENLNLFAVAYGETYEEQIDWALGIAEAYGLANNEVLKFAGTFRELSTSLGLVGDTADLVTKTVTNLGYDLSALFNTTVEQAMEKLQSGVFSGNVRPLRAYGIDISQQQINALFETNEALRQLGVNAQNLNQSDKVLARLIITLQSGKDSFGTMAREINNLQSQFRIFQGSLANFKLAIGDLINEPLREAMVYINGFLIGITNVIRAFVPLQKEDTTPKAIVNTALGAEEANEELDKLQEKLASFDKFNVLQQGGQSSSSLAVTEALNQLLLEQANLYESQLPNLDEINNRAVQIGESIKNWFVIDTGEVDETGNAIYKLTDNANKLVVSIKAISSAFALLKITSFISNFSTLGKNIKSAFSIKNIGIMAFASALSYAYITNEEFRKSVNSLFQTLSSSLKPVLDVVIGLIETITPVLTPIIQGLANLISNTIKLTEELGILEPAIYAIIAIKISKWAMTLSEALLKAGESATGLTYAIGALGAIAGFTLFDTLLNELDSVGKTIAGLIITLGAAATAWMIYHSTASAGIKTAAILTALGVGVAGVKGFISGIQGFSNGGYSNANLIMTHENGKREWVGKAAGSNAIVNDTQMSDIMEGSVAKGVFNALRANSAMGSTTPTNENIIIKIGEEEVFRAVRRTAKRQGVDFTSV